MLEQMTKEQIINQIKQIAERFDNISKVWLFGSVARREHSSHSDVDLVIEIIDQDAYLETWDEFRISMIEEFDLEKADVYEVSDLMNDTSRRKDSRWNSRRQRANEILKQMEEIYVR